MEVDHATLNRWVVNYSPLVAKESQKWEMPTSSSSQVDETYLQVNGQWMYLYPAVDKFEKTLDFMLSQRRDDAAATTFFKRIVENNGVPEKVAIDKSGANLAGLENTNLLFMLLGFWRLIDIIQSKYLNNIIEQDHRFIK